MSKIDCAFLSFYLLRSSRSVFLLHKKSLDIFLFFVLCSFGGEAKTMKRRRKEARRARRDETRKRLQVYIHLELRQVKDGKKTFKK